MKANELIKIKRKEKGLTLRDVALVVGVSEGTVSRWESGNIGTMRRENIEKLSKLLDISPIVLLDWDSYEDEREERQQLIAEFEKIASVSEIKNIEIAVDLLKRLEGRS